MITSEPVSPSRHKYERSGGILLGFPDQLTGLRPKSMERTIQVKPKLVHPNERYNAVKISKIDTSPQNGYETPVRGSLNNEMWDSIVK